MISEHEGVLRFWADGEYRFKLNAGEMKSLQQSRGRGFYLIWQDIRSTRAHIEDVTEVVRLGLIGGGIPPQRSQQLVDDYIVKPSRYLSAADLAVEIMDAAMMGVPEEELPKAQTPKEQTDAPSSDQMGTSPSENSTQ